MALVFKSKEEAVSEAPVEKGIEDMSLEELADKYAELSAKAEKILEKAKPINLEISEIQKAIMERVDSQIEPTEKMVVKASTVWVEIGEKAKSRTITDMEKVVELFGTETFLKVAKVGLADIDKYLTPEQIALCVSEEKTGRRSIKFTKKAK